MFPTQFEGSAWSNTISDIRNFLPLFLSTEWSCSPDALKIQMWILKSSPKSISRKNSSLIDHLLQLSAAPHSCCQLWPPEWNKPGTLFLRSSLEGSHWLSPMMLRPMIVTHWSWECCRLLFWNCTDRGQSYWCLAMCSSRILRSCTLLKRTHWMFLTCSKEQLYLHYWLFTQVQAWNFLEKGWGKRKQDEEKENAGRKTDRHVCYLSIYMKGCKPNE